MTIPLAAPTVGQSKLQYLRFVAFDAVGALLWAGTYIFLGCLLAQTIEHNARFLHLAARFAGLALVGAALSLFLARLARRHRSRRRFAAARITPEELHRRML
jgi:membrane protein DedA with SNARE-associated domain